ncbi:flavodoxin family protein [Chloroflexota bacterium]
MHQNKTDSELKVLVIYWSATVNTERVANAIQKALAREGVKPVIKKISEAAEEELYQYDLIFLGSPSYQFLPPEPVQNFVKRKMKVHGERGDIKLCAPKIAGKTAVVFCTYSGPHTGIKEATPVGKYLGQFFEHLGYEVAATWYIVGEFHGRDDISTKGKLGDIRGRPNQQDLAEVESNVTKLVKSLCSTS